MSRGVLILCWWSTSKTTLLLMASVYGIKTWLMIAACLLLVSVARNQIPLRLMGTPENTMITITVRMTWTLILRRIQARRVWTRRIQTRTTLTRRPPISRLQRNRIQTSRPETMMKSSMTLIPMRNLPQRLDQSKALPTKKSRQSAVKILLLFNL